MIAQRGDSDMRGAMLGRRAETSASGRRPWGVARGQVKDFAACLTARAGLTKAVL